MKKTMYFRWIALTEAVGFLSWLFSRNGIRIYSELTQKPPLTPPGAVFSIVWTILYGLMGVSAARVAAAPDSRDRSWGLNLFAVQLVMNFFWSLIFFNAQAYGFALIWLLVMWILIIGMIVLFFRVDRAAALLQLPYLLWVTFAGYLNAGVRVLNR